MDEFKYCGECEGDIILTCSDIGDGVWEEWYCDTCGYHIGQHQYTGKTERLPDVDWQPFAFPN